MKNRIQGWKGLEKADRRRWTRYYLEGVEKYFRGQTLLGILPVKADMSRGPYENRADSACSFPSLTITSLARWLAAPFLEEDME